MIADTLPPPDLSVDTQRVHTLTEFDLVATLVRVPRRTWSKRDLLEAVWGFTDYQPHLVEVHISSLRRKLEAAGPRLVHTERNGYVLRA